MRGPVNYLIAERNKELPLLLPAEESGRIYEYVIAGNGIFVRARRPELEVLMPWAACHMRGLARLEPYLKLSVPRVPASLVSEIFAYANTVTNEQGERVESLFYLRYHAHAGHWQVIFPQQHATRTRVAPVDSGAGSPYEQALIELHSHHDLSIGARFSDTDDRDEQNRLRIFSVIGHTSTRPEIRVRIGIFGHFREVDATEVFALPPHITDSRTRDFPEHHEEPERDITHQLRSTFLHRFISLRLKHPLSQTAEAARDTLFIEDEEDPSGSGARPFLRTCR